MPNAFRKNRASKKQRHDDLSPNSSHFSCNLEISHWQSKVNELIQVRDTLRTKVQMRDRIIERAHADNLKLRAKQSKLKEKLNELQEAREDLSNESGMRPKDRKAAIAQHVHRLGTGILRAWEETELSAVLPVSSKAVGRQGQHAGTSKDHAVTGTHERFPPGDDLSPQHRMKRMRVLLEKMAREHVALQKLLGCGETRPSKHKRTDKSKRTIWVQNANN